MLSTTKAKNFGSSLMSLIQKSIFSEFLLKIGLESKNVSLHGSMKNWLNIVFGFQYWLSRVSKSAKW